MKKKTVKKFGAFLGSVVLLLLVVVLPVCAYDNLPSTTVVVHGDFADWLELANGDEVYNWSVNFSDGNWFGYNADINPDACLFYDGTEYYPYDSTTSFVYVCDSYTTTDIDNVSAPLYVSVYSGGVGVSGYQSSLSSSYNNGYAAGLDAGADADVNNAYNTGYSAGYEAGLHTEDSFYTLFFTAVDAPLNAIKTMFSFEILGVNVAGFIGSLFMILVVVFVIKKLV